jgi:flagellin-like hook-associated protein FlgL
MATISTLGQNRLVATQLSRLQGQIDDLEQQVASGRKTDRYGDLGALAPLDISLRNKGQQIETFKTVIATLKGRTDVIDDVLGAVRQTVLDVRDQTVSANLSDTQRQNVIASAGDAVEDMLQKLQANVDGRYLFGGVETGAPPMRDADQVVAAAQAAVDAALANPVPDAATAVGTAIDGVLADPGSFYAGGAKHAATEIDEGVAVDYSVTGDDPAFKTALKGLLTIATLPMPADDPATPPALGRGDWDAIVGAAGATLTTALGSIDALQAGNGRAQALLDDTDAGHDAMLTIVQSQIDDIEQVDLADASTRLAQLRNQLEAAYSVVADLQQLSLVNFLSP